MFNWWADWKTFGALPYGGSDLLAQPAFVVEAIRTCEETLAEISIKAEEKRREKQGRDELEAKRKAKRKARR